MSQGSVYALVAAEEALTDANWKPVSEDDQIRTGYICFTRFSWIFACFSEFLNGIISPFQLMKSAKNIKKFM